MDLVVESNATDPSWSAEPYVESHDVSCRADVAIGRTAYPLTEHKTGITSVGDRRVIFAGPVLGVVHDESL